MDWERATVNMWDEGMDTRRAWEGSGGNSNQEVWVVRRKMGG